LSCAHATKRPDAGDPRQERGEAFRLLLLPLGRDLGMVVILPVAQRGALAELPRVEIEAVLIKIGAPLLLARVQGGGSLFDRRRAMGLRRFLDLFLVLFCCRRILRLLAFLQLFAGIGARGFDVALLVRRIIGEPIEKLLLFRDT
jgi:hypothetical protein